MSDDDPGRDDFLSRWSRRKSAARTGAKLEPEARALPAMAPATNTPAQSESPATEPLPPVESLTPESDFTPFMRSEVDATVRRQALRTLFRDPRFNEMDGLDVYIGDYSQPDPIPPEWLGQLRQMAHLGDHRPPEEPKDAAAEGAEEMRDGQIAQVEQGVGEPPGEVPADVGAEGSPPPELKQS